MFVCVIIFKDLSYHFLSVLCVYFCVYSLQTDIIVSLIHYFSVFCVWFVSALFYSLFCFFFLWSIYLYLHYKKKKKMNPYFKRWNPNTFLFSYLPILFLVLVFFFYDQYTCIFTVKKEKKKRRWTPIFKKMKSKHILIFVSDYILLLICLIHFAFLA